MVKTENVYLPVLCPSPMKPMPVNTRAVNPMAVQDQAGVWWVGISPDEYGNLSYNTESSIRFIKDQRGDLEYYRTCIDDFNKIVEEKNAKASPEAEPEVPEEAPEEVVDED